MSATPSATQSVLYPMVVKLPEPTRLTDRQIYIATLISSGLCNKEVSSKLNISVKTVETHRRNIYEALGIHGVVQLSLYAIRAGWVKVI